MSRTDLKAEIFDNQVNLTYKQSTTMKPSRLLILLWFITTVAVAQRTKNPCIYKSLLRKDKREETIKSHQSIYDFHAGDTVASIGAGGGSKEIIYSMMADNLVFYLQDINEGCLTPEIVRATVSELYNAAGLIATATFIPIIGTETETRLPNQAFDKIIIENTLHELTQPGEVLASVRTNLKPGGYLYIEDFMAKRPRQKHRGCRKPLFTEEALIQLLDSSGFQLLESVFTYAGNTDSKIYKFARKN